jgi:tetratricopeptide (TPR) repeat protein
MRVPFLALILLLACATSRTARLTEDASLERELAGKNDLELQAIGTAAAAAGDDARAAAAFGSLADRFPASDHAPGALLAAGLAEARRERFAPALSRFEALAARHPGRPEALEAGFRIAECHYHLGAPAEARAALDAIAARADLPAADRIRALAQRGVVELEDGRRDEAEASLRAALATSDSAGKLERLDPYYPAQARFHLGELYRASFEAAPLDPSRGDAEALRLELERKADLLLAAQDHYLGTIRMGDRRWAVAAGARVGELYESFRAELLGAPLPPGLGEAEAELYRAELGREVRVLASKAITAYEETLAAARTAGVEDVALLDETREALERLRAVAAAPEGDAAPER